MKKSLLPSLMAGIFLIGCQAQPCEPGYYEESPEIDLGKSLVEAYLAGNFANYTDFYVDTARIYSNVSWVDNDGMTPTELVAGLQEGLEPVSEYSMDPQIWDMVVTSEGNRWVHLWTVWHGTVEVTGKTYHIPVHISMNVVDNKIVAQADFFNDSEITIDMMALAAEGGEEETSEEQ